MGEQIEQLALNVQSIIRDSGYPEAKCTSLVQFMPDGSDHWHAYGVGVRVGELRHAVRFFDLEMSPGLIAKPLVDWLSKQ